MTCTRSYCSSTAARLGWPSVTLSLRPSETVGGDEAAWRLFCERATDHDVLDAAAELEAMTALAERGGR